MCTIGIATEEKGIGRENVGYIIGSAGWKLAFLGRKGRRVRRGITEFMYVFIYPKGQSQEISKLEVNQFAELYLNIVTRTQRVRNTL